MKKYRIVKKINRRWNDYNSKPVEIKTYHVEIKRCNMIFFVAGLILLLIVSPNIIILLEQSNIHQAIGWSLLIVCVSFIISNIFIKEWVFLKSFNNFEKAKKYKEYLEMKVL